MIASSLCRYRNLSISLYNAISLWNPQLLICPVSTRGRRRRRLGDPSSGSWGSVEGGSRGTGAPAAAHTASSPALRSRCRFMHCQRHRKPLPELPTLVRCSRRYWNLAPRLQARAWTVLFVPSRSQGSILVIKVPLKIISLLKKLHFSWLFVNELAVYYFNRIRGLFMIQWIAFRLLCVWLIVIYISVDQNQVMMGFCNVVQECHFQVM